MVIAAFYSGNVLYDCDRLVYGSAGDGADGQLQNLMSSDPAVLKAITRAEQDGPLVEKIVKIYRRGLTDTAPAENLHGVRAFIWSSSKIYGLARTLKDRVIRTA